MWFRSVYLKTLRDSRIAILGWGVGMGLFEYLTLATFPTTPQARASLVSLWASFHWLAEPVAITTAGGFTTFKNSLPILLVTLWPLLASSRMLRGEEERGSLDVLLSLPLGRVRVALEKMAGVWTALLVLGLLMGLLAFVGGRSVGADFGLFDALLFGLNIALICGVVGAIALLLSQFTQEVGTAAGWTAGLLLVFIVLDMAHRLIPNAEWLGRISPVSYYNLSKPLVPSYGANPGAMLVLMALNILLSGSATWIFARRDVGGMVQGRRFPRVPERTARPERASSLAAWSLRSVYARSLGTIVVPTFWWTLGIAGFAGWTVVVVKQTEAQLATTAKGSSFLTDLAKVGGSDVSTSASLLSALFVLLPLMLMAFAVTQANRWSADEEDGRLELVLSTPQPRLQVLLERFAALATATVIIAVLTLAVAAAASAATGLKLDGGNLAAATLSMIPMGLLMAAIGYLLSGWLRTAVDTSLLSFLLGIWFFITFVGPGLNWPDAALRLSAFYYYGTPLLKGLQLGQMLGVLAVGMLALALGSVRFMRKDIGR